MAKRLPWLTAFRQAQGHYQKGGPLFERGVAVNSQEFGPGARVVERT
jgi:hypothetical protein